MELKITDLKKTYGNVKALNLRSRTELLLGVVYEVCRDKLYIYAGSIWNTWC